MADTPKDHTKSVAAVLALALSVITLVIAIIGLAVSLTVMKRTIIFPKQFCFETPAAFIQYNYEMSCKFPGGSVENYFKYHNRNEILKTLEVVKVQTNGVLAVAFVRYSVGTKIFRETEWLRKVDGRYWFSTYLYKSMAETSKDPVLKQNGKWIEEMEMQIENWEAESAIKY